MKDEKFEVREQLAYRWLSGVEAISLVSRFLVHGTWFFVLSTIVI